MEKEIPRLRKRKTKEYTTITDDILVENAMLEFDLYIRSIVGGLPKYILFCRGNERFSKEKNEILLRKNEKKLYISTKDTDKYLKYKEKNLKYIIGNKQKSSKEKSNAVYQVAKSLVKDILDDPKSGKHLDRVSTWVSNTVNHILNDKNTFPGLFEISSYSFHIYTHSINMSAMGLLFGRHLSLKQYELDCLGTGMLLHDIGKTDIPIEIINKPGKLTEEEFKLVKKHPEAGMELLKNKDNIEELALKVVIQHHENYDGTGYPFGLAGDDIHLFGHISRILDAYDAITTRNSYSEAKRPFAALTEMKEEIINSFDKELFKEFIRFLGPGDPREKSRKDDKLYK